MPDEYIKRSDAIQALREAEKRVQNGGFVNPCGVIDSIPAADVAPVKRGKWVSDKWGDHYCSYCVRYAIDRGEFESGDILTDYCPNCGAKMDGEDDDAEVH